MKTGLIFFIIVPADGLAPLGARSSARKKMPNLGFVYMRNWHLNGWLTHFSLDKMADISADNNNLKCIFLNASDKISIWISLNFVPRSLIDNMPALFQAIAWRRTGNKPLPEPMLTQFTDAYMRH